ncbi:putative major facilitator superfamily transporter protein [Botrytis fragariae]|uniref:Putative major facilitator superfamily transporter protein n=1 Tax=Botrytis fragariae TaxID=1964551 RepID=A0A8H6ASY5_9HELO|nr:putative major facilitator superfamily transporter protein [Botrytis fragariae]KAF5872845.1 putative major facilitator superfamily transporter protein [Botrytis fragariae]
MASSLNHHDLSTSHGQLSPHQKDESTISHEASDTYSIHSTSSSIPSQQPPSNLAPIASHISNTQDAPIQQTYSNISIPDAIYDRIPPNRKLVIVALLSFCSFLAPISSTTVLAAVPEVANTYHSTGTIINLSNALYMLFMGLSPLVWGPLSQVYGRRWISLITSFLFTACSIGTALAPNLPAFFIFRILTAFQGTSFLTIGAACIGDIYRPTERGTAMGWFLSGTLIGPALGPFIGGIIVTFQSWRVIFWLQTALAACAVIGAYFLLPETIHRMKKDELVGMSWKRKAGVLWGMLNPWRVIKLYKYPNLIMVALASSSLVWNMYSLLTPVSSPIPHTYMIGYDVTLPLFWIRYVLNPRFHLTTPIQSGLFYLAPGMGYIVGTFFGGRYSDHITNKYIRIRGTRIPEDRLRSALPFMGIVIPACMLLYGWSVEKDFGGIPLPVIMMFLQGVAQLFCFPSLNTYCLDVMQRNGAEVIAGNYMIRYLFAATGSATVLPAVEKIGVGWFSTISAGFLVVSSAATWAAVRWGRGWRDAIDGKESVGES